MSFLKFPVLELQQARTKIFIGNLAPGAKIPVNFTITPEQETSLILTATYNNGNNPHKVTM